VPPSSSPLILIVDDFEDALDIYREYLSFKGFRVATASSGLEAITTALTERPALILMDLRMAHMTGAEAMHALRADPDFQAVPIIAFTAHALDEERRAALQAGFDDLIPKPCLPDELLAAVNRLLDDKSPSA
jgi:two-component system, cell cycle response regulator DivK